jgi:hypothetical protein
MMKSRSNARLAALALGLTLGLGACGGDDHKAGPDAGGDAGSSDNSADDHAYAVSSYVFDPSGTTSYVSVLGSLDAQTIDYTEAHMFGELADMWVYDGSVFVMSTSDVTITKFSVANGALVQTSVLSLQSYGPTEVGFYRNTFVSSTKAYFINGAAELIVWNPATMTITGTIPLPAQAARAGYTLYPGYSDRAAVQRGGKLYQPLYWYGASFFEVAPDSLIAVIDTATDTVETVLPVNCPGIDFGTADADGNLWFSSWVYAAGGAAVLSRTDTCVVKLPADGSAPVTAFAFKDVLGGRQGAALRYIGDGKGLVSVLFPDHATGDTTSANNVTFSDNWKFWLYDFAAGTAQPLDSFDWNDGGQYTFEIAGSTYVLMSKSDFSATSIYDLGDATAPSHLFDTMGWSTRLFQVR